MRTIITLGAFALLSFLSMSASADMSCWRDCQATYNATSLCGAMCGVQSAKEQAYCTRGCTREGFDSEICGIRCEMQLPAAPVAGGGQNSCWSQCLRDGTSADVCSNRCGGGAPPASDQTNCYYRCNLDGRSDCNKLCTGI